MALDYHLKIDTSLPAESLLAQLSDLQGFEIHNEGFGAPGVFGGARPSSSLSRTIIDEEFGISPTIDVWFRRFEELDESGYDLGGKSVISAACRILSRTSGDAVLLFNGEDPILLRKDNTVIVNQDWEFWKPWGRSLVTIPHELGLLAHL